MNKPLSVFFTLKSSQTNATLSHLLQVILNKFNLKPLSW